jgi:hypothetical protein
MDQQQRGDDETAAHERPDQVPAAEDRDVLAWLLSRNGDRLRGVAGEQDGFDPRQGVGQSS